MSRCDATPYPHLRAFPGFTRFPDSVFKPADPNYFLDTRPLSVLRHAVRQRPFGSRDRIDLATYCVWREREVAAWVDKRLFEDKIPDEEPVFILECALIGDVALFISADHALGGGPVDIVESTLAEFADNNPGIWPEFVKGQREFGGGAVPFTVVVCGVECAYPSNVKDWIAARRREFNPCKSI